MLHEDVYIKGLECDSLEDVRQAARDGAAALAEAILNGDPDNRVFLDAAVKTAGGEDTLSGQKVRAIADEISPPLTHIDDDESREKVIMAAVNRKVNGHTADIMHCWGIVASNRWSPEAVVYSAPTDKDTLGADADEVIRSHARAIVGVVWEAALRNAVNQVRYKTLERSTGMPEVFDHSYGEQGRGK